MFGFGKGKIRITLTQQQFSPGDEIQGTVIIKMKKPVDANELVITLKGTETVMRRNLKGESSSETHTICDSPVTLEGQKHHEAGIEKTYPFKIIIPKLPGQQVAEKLAEKNKFLGTAVAIASMAAKKRQKWWLRARLDVPGLDVRSKRSRINVLHE